MNLLGLLENGLFALGQVLRFPVMTLLWLCVIAVCFMAGSCFMEYLARRYAPAREKEEKTRKAANMRQPQTALANLLFCD